MLANVCLPCAALQAFSAGHVHFSAHQVAFTHRRDAPAHACNCARKFVSRNERRMNAAFCPGIPVVDMQVGSANAGRRHMHQHFTGTGRGHRHFAQLDAVRGLGFHYGLQSGWHAAKPLSDPHKHINAPCPTAALPSDEFRGFLEAPSSASWSRVVKRWRGSYHAMQCI